MTAIAFTDPHVSIFHPATLRFHFLTAQVIHVDHRGVRTPEAYEVGRGGRNRLLLPTDSQ